MALETGVSEFISCLSYAYNNSLLTKVFRNITESFDSINISFQNLNKVMRGFVLQLCMWF